MESGIGGPHLQADSTLIITLSFELVLEFLKFFSIVKFIETPQNY